MRFAILSLSLTALLASSAPCRAANFATDAKAWYEQHPEVFENAAQLNAEGYPSAGNQVLVSFAEQDGSPLAAYMIGNVLYGSDPSAAYRLHLLALEAFPQAPDAVLAVALDEHRHGEYARAIINYQFVLRTAKAAQFSALLADCLIRTGQLEAAVAAWNQAGPAKNAEAIETAICTVYGPLRPEQRRGDLIALIEAGDLTKFTDLILLDLSFDTDWWSAKVNDEALNADLKRASLALGRRDARYQALAVYAKLGRVAEKKQSEIKKALTDAQLVIGPAAELPTDSQIARALCELAVTAKVVTPAELWTAYQATLRSRVERQDHNALRLLCWLAAATRNPELTDFDRLGWEEWNDPAFASSFMVDLYREKKLTTPTDSQLLAAIAISPDNAALHNLRIVLAGDDVTNAMIVGAIKAEYHKLSVGNGRRDTTRLDALFDALGKRL